VHTKYKFMDSSREEEVHPVPLETIDWNLFAVELNAVTAYYKGKNREKQNLAS
jgi:hypothetical protein